MADDNRNLFPSESPVAGPSSPETTSAAEQIPAPPQRYIPEDLRVPWDWLDLLIFVLFAVGATIVFGLLLAMALALAHVGAAQIQKSTGKLAFYSAAAQIVLDLGLLGYLAMQVRLRFHRPFWRTIGWRPLGAAAPGALTYVRLVAGGLFLGLATSMAASLFRPKHALPLETFFRDPRTALLFMLTAVLVAPVFEETLFRGYIYPVIARSFGLPIGVIVTGTLFGLLHSMQLWGGWWQIVLLVIVGIVFTLVRARMRTVLASYILHTSYNSLQVIAMLVATHGLRDMSRLH